MEHSDAQRRRAAQNQSLFREVNERIDVLSARFAEVLATNGYVCECRDLRCTEQIQLTHEEYERLRAEGDRFFVIPGHLDADVEEVVATNDRYLVVEKLGVAAEVADALDPRHHRDLR